MTDRDWLLSVLQDGRERSLAEILARSVSERGCGLTVHSRVAELRKHGHTVEHRTVPGRARGHGHTYRLVGALREGAPLAAGASSSSAPASSPEPEQSFVVAASSPQGDASFLVGGGSGSGGEGGLPALAGRHGAQRDAATPSIGHETPSREVFPQPGFAPRGDATEGASMPRAATDAKPGSPVQLSSEAAA